MALDRLSTVVIALSFAWLIPSAEASVSPPQDSTLRQIHVQFEWPPIEGATGYHLTVSEAGGGASVVDEATTGSKPRLIVKEGLEFGKFYEWEVTGTGPVVNPPSIEHAFDIAPLPGDLPDLAVALVGFGDQEPGLTLFGLASLNGTIEDIAIAVDLAGNPIWFMNRGARVRDVRLLDDGRLMFFQGPRGYTSTLSGNTAWASPDDPELALHHEVFPMPNGDVLSIPYTFQEVAVDTGEAVEMQTWKGDRFTVFDRHTNAVVWDWNTFDYLSLEDFDEVVMAAPSCPGCNYLDTYAWTHANAVIYNEADNSVYGALRHLSRIVRIDFDSQAIVYQMGTEAPYMPSGDVDFGDDLFSWSHAPQLLPNGNMVLYDNGNRRDHIVHTNATGSTKAVELAFTGSPPTSASIVWEADLPAYTFALGDADRQPGGTTLTVQGTVAKIIEVDAAGESIWTLSLPLGQPSFQLYRAERIPSLLVDAPADADGDGHVDIADNCPDHPNPSQRDCDDDGFGDVCTLALGLAPELACERTLAERELDDAPPSGSVDQVEPRFTGAALVWLEEGEESRDQVHFRAATGEPSRISDPSFHNFDHSASGTHAAWAGNPELPFAADDEDTEIFYYNGATRSRVTDNDFVDLQPHVSRSRVIWVGGNRDPSKAVDRSDLEVFLVDMDEDGGEEMLTDNSLEEANPQISPVAAVWRARTGNAELMFDDGETRKVGTQDTLSKRNLHTDGDRAVWEAWDGFDWEIFYYDGNQAFRLTDNDGDDTAPQIGGAGVVWENNLGGVTLVTSDGYLLEFSVAGSRPQISDSHFTYLRGSDNRIVYQGLTSKEMTFDADAESVPQLSGANLAWIVDGDLHYYDGSFQMLSETGEASAPAVSGDGVAWVEWDGEDKEIFYHDGLSTDQLTDDVGFDQDRPRIAGNQIVWEKRACGQFYDTTRECGEPDVIHHDVASATSTLLTEGFAKCAGSLADSCQTALSEQLTVWRETRSTWADDEIMTFDGSDIMPLTTRNRRNEMEPTVSGTQIAWLGFPEPDWEIFHYDGETVSRLTDDDLDADCPVVDGHRAAWVDREPDDDGLGPRNGQIRYFDGRAVAEVTGSAIEKDCPSISGSRVAWSGGVFAPESEVYLWEGNGVVQITNDSVFDLDPQLSSSQLAWTKDRSEVHFYNGFASEAVEGAAGQPGVASLSGATVAWSFLPPGGGTVRNLAISKVLPVAVPEPALALLQLGALVSVTLLARARRRGDETR